MKQYLTSTFYELYIFMNTFAKQFMTRDNLINLYFPDTLSTIISLLQIHLWFKTDENEENNVNVAVNIFMLPILL